MLRRIGSPRAQRIHTQRTNMWLICGMLALLLTLAIAPARPAHAQEPPTSAQGDSDSFVEATVDRTDPFLGEEIRYTFRYYEAVDSLRLPGILVGQPDYDAPEFSNFWQEGQITQVNFQEVVNQRLYNVSELHTTLFPTAAGEIVIPPARLILNGGFSGPTIELTTLPVTVGVKPLPSSSAPNFAGAVGDYTLAARVDSNMTEVDEPITLELTLRGTGNIRLAPAPALPELDGWRILEQGSTVVMDEPAKTWDGRPEGKVAGTRTTRYLLFPSQAGEFSLPPIEYQFFDPAQQAFKGALTQPIPLSVIPAPGSTAIPVDPAAANAATASEPASAPLVDASAPVTEPAAAIASTTVQSETIANDTMASDTMASDTPNTLAARTVETLYSAPVTLPQQPWYWALWALPLAAVALAGWGALRSRRAVEIHSRNQRARAGSDALRALHGGQSASPAEICDAAQRALVDFLTRKLSSPIAAMPRAALALVLTERGVQSTLAERVIECMRLGDVARFSPAGVDAHSASQMQTAIEATIRDLDKVL